MSKSHPGRVGVSDVTELDRGAGAPYRRSRERRQRIPARSPRVGRANCSSLNCSTTAGVRMAVLDQARTGTRPALLSSASVHG